MSWPVASLVVLAIGLAAGFAWYERTRPDARIVALVGSLAALGALGRIAFAAVPNVKPTGDIVLISGYALGGAPGYVVGAVAALTSNFFFGQGPWTPWQMAGWGITGVAGALLARLTRRRIGRTPLALVSFVLGFAFTAFQDFGDWAMYSGHSLAQLGAYVGAGLGFDLIYAVGCFGFAMLFGPALVRMLERFRSRIQVSWLPGASGGSGVVLIAVAVALSAGAGAAVPAAPARAAVVRPAAAGHGSPVRYLLAAQNRNGGWGAARGQPPSSMFTAWALLALEASGRSARTRAAVRAGLGYLAPEARRETDPGSVERTIMAVADGGENPRWFGQVNLVARLEHMIGRDGSIEGLTNLTTFGALALHAAGVAVPPRLIAWLTRQQDSDGGFNYATAGGPSDVDDTGAVLAVLGEPGVRRRYPRVLRRAVAYLRAQQSGDGGFGVGGGAPSNAQSTAFAVCGLVGAGIDPATLHRRGAPSPLAYLRSLIAPDGALQYARGQTQTPVWVTAEAQIALAGRAF